MVPILIEGSGPEEQSQYKDREDENDTLFKLLGFSITQNNCQISLC